MANGSVGAGRCHPSGRGLEPRGRRGPPGAASTRSMASSTPIVRLLADEALAAADASRSRPSPTVRELGPLHGVPCTVKENIDVAGTPTTQGVVALAEAVAAVDAPTVARMRAAGAIPFARTNLPDLGLRIHTHSSLHGLTRNPWNPHVTAGGSSGGEASALASGMSPIGLGNDIGGSLRNPAHCCGIASIKPSIGRRADGDGDPAGGSDARPATDARRGADGAPRRRRARRTARPSPGWTCATRAASRRSSRMPNPASGCASRCSPNRRVAPPTPGIAATVRHDGRHPERRRPRRRRGRATRLRARAPTLGDVADHRPACATPDARRRRRRRRTGHPRQLRPRRYRHSVWTRSSASRWSVSGRCGCGRRSSPITRSCCRPRGPSRVRAWPGHRRQRVGCDARDPPPGAPGQRPRPPSGRRPGWRRRRASRSASR